MSLQVGWVKQALVSCSKEHLKNLINKLMEIKIQYGWGIKESSQLLQVNFRIGETSKQLLAIFQKLWRTKEDARDQAGKYNTTVQKKRQGIVPTTDHWKLNVILCMNLEPLLKNVCEHRKSNNQQCHWKLV